MLCGAAVENRTKRGGGGFQPLRSHTCIHGMNLLYVLGLGDGTGGGEEEGGHKMNWSYGMAGWIGNEVI